MPKPADQRRRRNAPTVNPKAVPASGRKGRKPKPMTELGEEAAAWWAWAWKLPVATLWTDADLAALTRLAILQGRYLAGVDGAEKQLGEIRALEDRFGLNFVGRERLGIYEVEDVPTDKRTAEKARPEALGGRNLRAV